MFDHFWHQVSLLFQHQLLHTFSYLFLYFGSKMAPFGLLFEPTENPRAEMASKMVTVFFPAGDIYPSKNVPWSQRGRRKLQGSILERCCLHFSSIFNNLCIISAQLLRAYTDTHTHTHTHTQTHKNDPRRAGFPPLGRAVTPALRAQSKT